MPDPEQQSPAALSASDRLRRAGTSTLHTAHHRAASLGYGLRQDYADILARYKQADKKLTKQIRKAWKTAPLPMRKASNHAAKLRTIPVILIALFFVRLFLSSPSTLLATLFSFVSLVLIAGAYLSYRLARRRAIEFSAHASEWLWERLPNDEQAALFEQHYGQRNAGDLIAPWLQARSRTKDWMTNKLAKLKPRL